MKLKSKHASLLAPAFVFAFSGAAAQSNETLDTVVVTGELYTFGAQKVITVTEEDLEITQAADLGDVFALDPSVQVGGSLPSAQKIYVRGIEDKLLHISVDGAPQGGYLSHHHGQYLIEPELLKYVEVEPGPGGVTQGPGALAGSIRFATKGPADFLDGEQRFGMFNKVSYFDNAEAARITSALYGDVSDDLALLGAFTYFDADDFVDGNGDQVDYTAHTQRRGFAKAVATLPQGSQLSLSAEHLADKGTFRHRPNFVGDFAHPLAPNIPVAMELSRDTATLSFVQVPNGSTGIEANVYYSDTAFDRDGQYEMGYESWGFGVRDTRNLGTHALTYGLDYRDDSMSFTGKGSITGFARTLVYRTIPDETVQIVGAFAQDDWSATDALQVSFGARVDHYDYEDKDGQRYRDTGVSPTLGASYAVIEGLRLNASYGLSFRGVTVIDAITSNEGGIRNAASIDPERATNAEIGFQYQAGIFLFSGTVYRQKIDDLIIDANNDSVRGNEGTLEVTGFDLTAGVRIAGFDASLAVSESDPELDDRNLVDTSFGIGASYGRSWNSYVGYRFAALRLNVGWSINYVEAFDETPAGIPGKPSYAVHGAHAQWAPLPDERLAVTLTAANVFDKYYVDQATSGWNAQLNRVAGLPEPGRDIRVSAAYRF